MNVTRHVEAAAPRLEGLQVHRGLCGSCVAGAPLFSRQVSVTMNCIY